MSRLLAIKEIQKRLEDRNLTAVSERCGLSLGTLRNLKAADSLDSFSFVTVKRISDYLTKDE